MRVAVALLFLALVRLASAQATVSNAEALNAIYTDYDSVTQTADGASWKGNNSAVKRIHVDVILSVQVNTVVDGPRAYVVTSAVPQSSPTETYDCHACAPDIGFGLFSYARGTWKVESSSAAVDNFGAWGQPPDVDLVRVGPDLYGVRLTAGDMHQEMRRRSRKFLLPMASRLR
jgi:hypothetical protein